jgi:putative oxidoreductase
MTATLSRYAPWMLGVLRIVTALVYLAHGTQKILHFPAMGGGRGPGAAARAAQQGAEAASSAVNTAVDAASSALSTAGDAASSALQAASSMVASAPPGGGAAAAQGAGMPRSMQTIFLIGGLIELVGGIALVLGLLTRPVAFIVAGECAVIFWWMHVGQSGNIMPISNGGESAVLFCFTFLYLVFAGPGAFAVDGLLARRRAA